MHCKVWNYHHCRRHHHHRRHHRHHHYYHHHHPSIHPSLNREGRWSTTDDFTTSFLHLSLFSTALWDLSNSRPVHSLISSHLFPRLPCLLQPFTVPCKMVLARLNERETWQYHCSVRLFTVVRRSPCGPIACWILALTSPMVMILFGVLLWGSIIHKHTGRCMWQGSA